MLDLDGGRARAVSRMHHDVEEVAWSPDGSRLAFTAEVGPPRFLVGPERRGETPLARVIRRLDYRYDESGFLDRWAHLFVVAAAQVHGRAAADRRRLRRRRYHVASRRTDDRVRRRPQARRGPPAGDVDLGGRRRRGRWRGRRRAARPRQLLALAGWATRPAFSPDGRWLAVVGVDDPDAPDDLSPTVFVGPADGGGPARPLAPDLDRPIGHWNDTDLTGWTGESRTGPAWLDPGTVIAIVSDRGREVPWAFPVDDPGSAGAPAATPLAGADADATLINLAVGGGAVTCWARSAGGRRS